MFDRILVAVDPNEYNMALVDRAIALASATDAELKLISVLTGYGEGAPPMFVYPGIAGYPPVLEDSLWEDYQERYETYANEGLEKTSASSDTCSILGRESKYHAVFKQPWARCLSRGRILES